MISNGSGFVSISASVEASSVGLQPPCLLCLQSVVRRWRWKLGLKVRIHVTTSKFAGSLGGHSHTELFVCALRREERAGELEALFIPRKDPVPIVQEAGWASGPVWTSGKSRPYRVSIPDRPARSQSLYRQSYPSHNLQCHKMVKN